MFPLKIADWLNELERTTLPQNVSDSGTAENPCALTVAIGMAGEEFSSMPTDQAMALLGARESRHTEEALQQVYRWNDRGLSFAQIADKFRSTYPELI
jgi:hypothetical protein